MKGFIESIKLLLALLENVLFGAAVLLIIAAAIIFTGLDCMLWNLFRQNKQQKNGAYPRKESENIAEMVVWLGQRGLALFI